MFDNKRFTPWLLLLGGSLLLASPGSAQIYEGDRAGDRLGFAVAAAGDVNVDGYLDALVGVPGAVGPAGAAGAVRVYFGGPGGLAASPGLVLTGEVSGDEFGFAVSAAGDVDDDGIDDFLVGAPGHDGAGVSAGRVYLFLGGAPPGTTAARTWDGDVAGARFGAAVAGGFNFNGDAFSDFAAGAPERNDLSAGLRAGEVRIFLGAATAGAVGVGHTFVGSQANVQLGYSLDSAGDVNSDGRDDVVAGGPQRLDLNPGLARIYFGTVSGPPAQLLLTGEVGQDRFGWSVSGAGDINLDGFHDVVVGAPGHDSQGVDKGAVYLYYGGLVTDAVADWKAVGAVGGDSLGVAVDGGFDLNGDARSDIAAGAPGADMPAAGAGEVRMYYGASNPNVNGDRVEAPSPPVSSFEAGDGFGSAVRFAGSVDDDPRSELLVGAPRGDGAAGAAAGYVNVFTESSTPVRALSFLASTTGTGVRLTWALVDAHELSGLRVEAERSGVRTALHAGWLPADATTWLHPNPEAGTTVYHLSGLDRAGGLRELSSVRHDASFHGLSLGAPDANPFRGSIRFQAALPAGPAGVTVWDARGRRVRTLLSTSAGGTLELSWDGRDDQGVAVPAGLYFVRARAGQAQAGFKVIRLP